VFLTDRKYYDNRSKKHPGQVDKKCLVCGKTGCWSSNHPQSEQKVAFDKLARSKGMPQQMRQYITEYEGIPLIESTSEYENLIDSLPLDDDLPPGSRDTLYAIYGVSDPLEVFL